MRHLMRSALRSALIATVMLASTAPQASRGVSRPSRQAAGSDSARRSAGPRGAAGGAGDVGGVRAVGRRGEPPRRQRQSRGGGGRQGARRTATRCCRAPTAASSSIPMCTRGSASIPLKDLVPVASIATNQFMLAINPKVPARTPAGVHRLCARGKPAARLCVRWRRQPAALRHGGAQATRRHQPAPRALSRRSAVGDRDHRRRDAGPVRGRVERGAVRGGKPAAAGGERKGPVQAVSRYSRPSASSTPVSRSTSGSDCSRRSGPPMPWFARFARPCMPRCAVRTSRKSSTSPAASNR